MWPSVVFGPLLQKPGDWPGQNRSMRAARIFWWSNLYLVLCKRSKYTTVKCTQSFFARSTRYIRRDEKRKTFKVIRLAAMAGCNLRLSKNFGDFQQKWSADLVLFFLFFVFLLFILYLRKNYASFRRWLFSQKIKSTPESQIQTNAKTPKRLQINIPKAKPYRLLLVLCCVVRSVKHAPCG